MENYVLKNDFLCVEIATFGAELQSIRDNFTGFEYIWHGDKTYWARRSPILFPIVGKVWNGSFRYEGKEYLLSQHGFARDCEFELINIDLINDIFDCQYSITNTLAFLLQSNDQTRKVYPFDFSLYVVYQLEGRTIKVDWLVENKTDGDIYFQIGAHPAFNYRDFDAEASVQGYIRFNKDGLFRLTQLECGGYASNEHKDIVISCDGIVITKETFAGDALVLENQVNKVYLCDRQGNSYVEVDFDAPVVGLWSPAKQGYAPFVCIEPWYGRCDDSNYMGDYKDKPYVNYLQKRGLFHSSYAITLR